MWLVLDPKCSVLCLKEYHPCIEACWVKRFCDTEPISSCAGTKFLWSRLIRVPRSVWLKEVEGGSKANRQNVQVNCQSVPQRWALSLSKHILIQKCVISGCRLTASVSCSIILHLSLYFIPLFYQQPSPFMPKSCGGVAFGSNAKIQLDRERKSRMMEGKREVEGDSTESGRPPPFSCDSCVLH